MTDRSLHPLRSDVARALLVVGVAVLACVTVNVYFPESEVKALSERIEDAVRAEAEAGGEQPTTGAAHRPPARERSGTPPLFALLAFATPAAAQPAPPAPEISNPAIRRIVDSRAQRFAEVQRFKQQGVLGENRDGMLEIRSLDALPLPQRAAVQRLVKEENEDRRLMYDAIADAKGVERSQLPLVRATYAETLRAYARPGEWIQLPDGQWVQKSGG